jgi:MFS family permease
MLDQAPLTRSHIRVWLLAAMGVMLDGFDFFIIGVATPLIADDLGASPWEIGMISASALAPDVWRLIVFRFLLRGDAEDRSSPAPPTSEVESV